MDRSLRNALVAESFGTFLFVAIGAGAVVTTTYQGASNAGLVGVALAHALALGVLVSTFAGISGGHLNPAVTVGLLTAGKIKAAPAGMYIVVQLVAASWPVSSCDPSSPRASGSLRTWACPASAWTSGRRSASPSSLS